MAYSEELADRIRDTAGEAVTEKMFGGVAFLLNGNMAVGVSGDELMVRVGPDANEQAASEPGVAKTGKKMGRPMTGWVWVSATQIADDGVLNEWVDAGLEFAGSLPPK